MPPEPEPWQLTLGLVVILLAIWAVARRLEVRLTMLLAGGLLAIVAGRPQAVVQTFLATFADEKFVVPICTAMGFAHVLRHTGCDRHLIYLLVRPLLRVRLLLIPGTVIVAFLVNMPIVSQTSTAATLGPVILPILRAANVSPITSGAALLLGSSIGGELLNLGAPEIQTMVDESQKAARLRDDATDLAATFTRPQCVRRLLPLDLVNLAVATLLFWLVSLRHERREPAVRSPAPDTEPEAFRINPAKAAIPLLPLVLLYLTSPPLTLLEIPREWLAPGATAEHPGPFESRLIGCAMVLGSLAAALVSPRTLPSVVGAFCEGAGFAFAHIISLITAASVFGRGLKEIGLAGLVGRLIEASPAWLLPAAGALPLGFAVLCGSGMATTQSLFGFFAAPALSAGVDPIHVGALVAIAAAAGRTISPVAAITLVVATMSGTHPLQLARRVAWPTLIALAVTVAVAIAIAPGAMIA